MSGSFYFCILAITFTISLGCNSRHPTNEQVCFNNKNFTEKEKEVASLMAQSINNRIYWDNSTYHCCFIDQQERRDGKIEEYRECISATRGIYRNEKQFSVDYFNYLKSIGNDMISLNIICGYSSSSFNYLSAAKLFSIGIILFLLF